MLILQKELLNARKNNRCPSTKSKAEIKCLHKPLNQINILAVEDSPLCQKIVLWTLRKLGFNASLAVNGLDALDKYQRDHFDLILLDIELPDVTGMEVCRYIRKEFGDCISPIIAYSSNLSASRQEYFEVGFNEILIKPADEQLLDKTIKKLIKVNLNRSTN